jgi:hypothetical protein
LLETDAPPKYFELFGLKFTKFREFKEKQGLFGDIKYKNFLASNYPNFFVYLFTCQECLCVWFNIIGFTLFSSILGGWQMFGITTILSLVGIALFNFIIKRLYE